MKEEIPAFGHSAWKADALPTELLSQIFIKNTKKTSFMS